MANGLMGLSNLLGQSSSVTSGLFGSGVFSQPESRGSRRSRLLTEAISSQPSSAGRFGAAIGGLLGTGIRAGAEGLGIFDAPPEVQRNQAIRQVQQEVAELGVDPVENPAEFGEIVSNRFRELGQPELAMRTQLQIQQMMPEQTELPAEAQNLAFRAQQAGLKPGSDQYREFMLSGGELPQQEGVEVKSSSRYRDKETGDTLTLVRTDRGLARQKVGVDGQPEYEYVSGDRYERISAQEAGGPGDFNADFSDLASRRNITLSFIDQADELASQITPETVGLPGGVARGLSSLSSQIQGSFRAAFGSRLEAPTDVESYSNIFENLGLSEQSAEIQSALIDLAVSKAYLDQNGKGDVRKSEVDRALQTLRAGSGDPQQIRAALGRLREKAANDFNIALDTATKQSNAEAPFGQITLQDISAVETPEDTDEQLKPATVSQMSRSELVGLLDDENQIPNDPAVLDAINARIEELSGENNGRRVTPQRGGGAR